AGRGTGPRLLGPDRFVRIPGAAVPAWGADLGHGRPMAGASRGRIDRADGPARFRRDVSQHSCSITFRSVRMTGTASPQTSACREVDGLALVPEGVRDTSFFHPGLVAVPHVCGASLATTGS